VTFQHIDSGILWLLPSTVCSDIVVAPPAVRAFPLSGRSRLFCAWDTLYQKTAGIKWRASIRRWRHCIDVKTHFYCYIHDYKVANWEHLPPVSGMSEAGFEVKFGSRSGLILVVDYKSSNLFHFHNSSSFFSIHLSKIISSFLIISSSIIGLPSSSSIIIIHRHHPSSSSIIGIVCHQQQLLLIMRTSSSIMRSAFLPCAQQHLYASLASAHRV
jgi:hypothetical protein